MTTINDEFIEQVKKNRVKIEWNMSEIKKSEKKKIERTIWNICWSVSMHSPWVPTIPIEITLSFLSNYWFSAQLAPLAHLTLSIYLSFIHRPNDRPFVRPSTRHFHVTSKTTCTHIIQHKNLHCRCILGMGLMFSVNK